MGKIGHMRMGGNCSYALFGAKDTKNCTGKCKRKIEFRMEGVPAGKKSTGGIVGSKGNNANKQKKYLWPKGCEKIFHCGVLTKNYSLRFFNKLVSSNLTVKGISVVHDNTCYIAISYRDKLYAVRTSCAGATAFSAESGIDAFFFTLYFCLGW